MMKELQAKHDTAMLMITHDLGIVAEMCDKCAIIYAGEIVEYGVNPELGQGRGEAKTYSRFND